MSKIITCPNPSNDILNPLQANNFILSIPKLPDANYLIPAVTIPNFNLGVAQMSTPLSNIKNAGDKLSTSELGVTFTVNKRMSNYLLFYYWLFSMSFPTDHEEFQNMPNIVTMNDVLSRNVPLKRDLNIIKELNNQTDIILYVLANKGETKPIAMFTFYNAFITSLAGLEFYLTGTDVPTVLSTATFEFDYMIPEVIND